MSGRRSRAVGVLLVGSVAALAAAPSLAVVGSGPVVSSGGGVTALSPARVVVGDPGSLTVGDQVLIGELNAFGFAVDVVDDADSADWPGVSAGTTVLIAPSSVLGSAAAEVYRDAGVPVVALGGDWWDALSLTTGVDPVPVSGGGVSVVDPAHPVVRDLPATFTATGPVTGAASGLVAVGVGALPGGADLVAKVSAGSAVGAAVVYTVEAGEVLGDGVSVAAARRVALGLTDAGLSAVGAEGLEVVDRAITWAHEGVDSGTAEDSGAGSARAESAGELVNESNSEPDVDPDPGPVDGAAAAYTLVGRWPFDRINAAAVKTTPEVSGYAGSAVNNRGVLDSDSEVRDILLAGSEAERVAPAGAGSLLFPGWMDETPDDTVVDATNSSVRIPSRDYFNPGTSRRFTVTVHIRPGDNNLNPNPAESPNIAQKGLFLPTDPGEGQWKISMALNPMRPNCAFIGDTDPSPTVTTRTVRQKLITELRGGKMTPGKNYKIECILLNGTVTARLYLRNEDNAFDLVGSSPDPAPEQPYYNVVNNDQVWVGKKANDETSGDTFVGAIDELTIRNIPAS